MFWFVYKNKFVVYLLQEKIDEFTMQKRASDQLISENRELNSYKRTVLILEQEKRELETKINTYRESSPGMNTIYIWLHTYLSTYLF